MTIAYLQFGAGTAGPFYTVETPARLRGWPHTGQYELLYDGRWRVVQEQSFNLFIRYHGQKVKVLIWGVCYDQ
jgi:hypothetical protein